MIRIFFFIALLFFLSCENKKVAEEKTTDSVKKTLNVAEKLTDSALDLYLNPEIGKEYIFESTMNQKILQKLDTISNETKVNQSIIYSLKPLWKDSNNCRFLAKFLEIEQNITSPVLSVKASTKSRPAEPTPLDLFYASLKGKAFAFSVNRRGENLTLLGFDSLINVVIEEMMKKKEFKGVDKSLIAELVGNFFNQKELEKSFQKLFEIYPKQKVRVGDSWRIEKHLREPVPTEIINNFVLKSIQNGSLVIDLVSDVKFEKIKANQGEPEVKELNGRQSGSLIVNRISGMLQNGKLNQQIRLVHQIPPSPQTNNKAVSLVTNINTNFILVLK